MNNFRFHVTQSLLPVLFLSLLLVNPVSANVDTSMVGVDKGFKAHFIVDSNFDSENSSNYADAFVTGTTNLYVYEGDEFTMEFLDLTSFRQIDVRVTSNGKEGEDIYGFEFLEYIVYTDWDFWMQDKFGGEVESIIEQDEMMVIEDNFSYGSVSIAELYHYNKATGIREYYHYQLFRDGALIRETIISMTGYTLPPPHSEDTTKNKLPIYSFAVTIVGLEAIRYWLLDRKRNT